MVFYMQGRRLIFPFFGVLRKQTLFANEYLLHIRCRKETMKRKVIIDCDPGIDDSLALLYALQHPDLEVLALTIVAGNVPVDLGVDNACKILERLGRLDLPVYAGAAQPLVREFVSAQDTHGMDGLGETYIERKSDKTAEAQEASHFLAEFFSQPQEVSIISLGPLTNIAAALQENPKLGNHVERFVSMGGSFKSHGNCSPVAEYNYWCDPDAAQVVYQQLQSTIEMVGLDVTREIVLTPNILEYIRFLNPEVGDFIGRLTRFYWDFHWEYEHIIGCVINDPLAVAHFIHRDLCQGFESSVEVVTEGLAIGQTIVDAAHFYKRPANSLVLTSVNAEAFFIDFIARIVQLSPEFVKSDIQEGGFLS